MSDDKIYYCYRIRSNQCTYIIFLCPKKRFLNLKIAIAEYFEEVIEIGKEYGLQSRYFYDDYGVIMKDSMYFMSGRYILHREDATVVDKGK